MADKVVVTTLAMPDEDELRDILYGLINEALEFPQYGAKEFDSIDSMEALDEVCCEAGILIREYSDQYIHDIINVRSQDLWLEAAQEGMYTSLLLVLLSHVWSELREVVS